MKIADIINASIENQIKQAKQVQIHWPQGNINAIGETSSSRSTLFGMLTKQNLFDFFYKLIQILSF